MEKHRFGHQAEELAAHTLQQKGYHILERNWRISCGELDLVAKDGEILVFCEIKARASVWGGEPGEAIDGRKQNRLLKLATAYLRAHPHLSGSVCRFDAVLIWRAWGQWRIEVIADAFRPGWE
ncbi:MAG: YraN family protein [Magnetococcales bacterium]|nr:YraN family protein [Magnetococcales bacterium]